MELHEPFIIGPRLLPALMVGAAFISLERIDRTASGRQQPVFHLDIGYQSHVIDDIRSGMQGYRSTVEPFADLLGFMTACAESISFTKRTGQKGDNSELFAAPIAQWCADNVSALEELHAWITDDGGDARHELIAK